MEGKTRMVKRERAVKVRKREREREREIPAISLGKN